MKHTLLILSMLLTSMSYAQSKKELIYRVDSLNSVVDSWKTIYSTEKSENLRLKNDISNLQTTITNLNSQVSNLTKELNLKKSEAQNQYQELSKIKEQLKVKSDSLNLVKNELDKLKPPPVKVNSAPPVANQQVGPYKTVRIGTQVWMTKNLDVSTFRNGDPIPEAKTDEEWKKAGENKQPAWCYYNNDPGNGEKFGKLYNWYAVNDSRGLAPVGYHIPSDAEWTTLIDFSGGESVAAIKMKNTSGWDIDGESYNGTNESGFSSLPGGFRGGSGSFLAIGEYGLWWNSTEVSTFNAGFCKMESYYRISVYRSFCNKANGYSVRCIKD
jgi:uncharacterized protein (TIGR02145 family)